ncbi:MAG: MlaD family protein [Bacteroidota bacterium]|nr:MlaD family protein [Bacteroidota bacterium]MDP3145860.1 MlaD family protein [Bacteroidota bacterium]MDP3558494.1 MlaD family protein [Bacteroidota bacterium]
MAAKDFRNVRLGIFVLVGTGLLIAALYLIGSKQNLFGSTFHISANFNNVSGLMKGNNVRFAGINVGTVESVEIVSDTSVNVVMIIENSVQKFIKKNALASVGTDGLMGNKLVNINSVNEPSESIEEDDVLQSLKPVEMDQMVRTLDVTNENIKVISTNLRNITDKINSKNSLWNLLMDTVVAENVKSSIVNMKLMSNEGLYITGDLKAITQGIKNGKGSIGALITDTLISSKIKQSVITLQKLSDTAAIVTGDISQIVRNLKHGKGTMGVLLTDTSLIHNLNTSVKSINKGAVTFDEDMKALQSSWPFKKYFKKQKKAKK